MTGLDKIIEEIRAESAENTEKIIAQANEKAQQIISEAEQKGQKQSEQIIKNAEKNADDIINRGESSANLEQNRALLVAKQQVINEMISQTLSYMESLDDEQYFSLILKLAAKNSKQEKGEIAFSKKDLDRLPKNFIKKINAVSKGELTISKAPVKISSGFILIYGGIEENCSFEAMFRSKHEELTDEISALLFSD